MSDFTDSFRNLSDPSGEDWEALLLALAEGSGEEGFTEDRFAALTDWAQEAIVQFTLAGMLFTGDLLVSWKEDDWMFKLSKQGEDNAKAIIDSFGDSFDVLTDRN